MASGWSFIQAGTPIPIQKENPRINIFLEAFRFTNCRFDKPAAAI